MAKETLTKEEARRRGFTVQTNCYPHIGFVGESNEPDKSVEVYTDLEALLLEKVDDLEEQVDDLKEQVDDLLDS